MRKISYYLIASLAVVSFLIITFFLDFVRVDYVFMEEITLIVGGFFGVILICTVGDKHNEGTKQ